MRVGVVDIGSNSMRLLITDGVTEHVRIVEVTGLGRGVDETGLLGKAEMRRTVEVLRRFGDRMDEGAVARRGAVATSATRDASNRDFFLTAAADALGVMPDVISGEREGNLAFAGATAGLNTDASYLVADIGGGSTELVTSTRSVSIDVGSVRLTDRSLPSRPAAKSELDNARSEVRSAIRSAELPGADQLVGVAGTWTSLAAIDLGLERYDRAVVHHHVMGAHIVSHLVDLLGRMSVEETAEIPSLDSKRAPVILAGSVIAEAVMEVTGAAEVLVSERDSLDGLAAELIGLP